MIDFLFFTWLFISLCFLALRAVFASLNRFEVVEKLDGLLFLWGLLSLLLLLVWGFVKVLVVLGSAL